MLERQLIKVQGVISIVFDAHNSRVTLRSRPDLSVEAVGQAVRKTQTMRAFLVGKNEMGEETLKPIGDSHTDDDGLSIYSKLYLFLLFIIFPPSEIREEVGHSAAGLLARRRHYVGEVR